MSGNKNIDWFWAHRRNASLHHFSFLMYGLRGKGWLPVVDFWFDHQIVVGVPGKGCYVFYDKNQLSSAGKYRSVQDSIDANPNFVADFRRRTDEIFGAIFFKCINIDNENLPLLSPGELLKLYNDFIQAITVAPVITVQLWGIEACFDEKYKIAAFLRQRLQELGKSREYENYKGLLQVNTGETVAVSEQKNFFQVASRISQNQELKDLFVSQPASSVAEALPNHPFENSLIEKHIEKYSWINTEYVSGGWSKEKWIDLFQKAITAEVSPEKKLDEVLSNFKNANQEREKILEELNPPREARHAIDSVAEFIAQRDWAKGYFTRILLSYHKLLDEIAVRMGTTRGNLFSYAYKEIEEYLASGRMVPDEVIADRQANGFIILSKDGGYDILTGRDNIQNIIRDEGISEPFDKVINVTEFKGLAASPGLIQGKARVIEDASMVSQLQAGEILVTYMTTIEFIPAFRKAAAVITDEGGISCHAAIISREFKIPCVVGTKIATRVIQTGDQIEVDATKGLIKILNNDQANE